MRRWMMAGGAAVLMAAGLARAVEPVGLASSGPVDLKVADDVTNGFGRFSGLDYATSDSFRRAWLVLHYRYRAQCPDSDGQCEADAPVEASVPGLSYDPAAKQVVYERPGADPVVCATARKGRFAAFHSSPLAATGKCTTRLVKVDRLVDDGFGGRKDRREEVHFAVASP